MIDAQRLSMCQSLLDAVHLCIHLSKLPHYVIAGKLGIDRGHWTRMMQGQAHFPTNKLQLLMEVCRNFAPLQWLAKSSGLTIYEDPLAMEERDLEARLAVVKARRAA